MSKKVLIVQPIAQEGIDLLKEAGLGIKELSDTSIENIKKEIKDVDAMLVRTAEIPAEVLEKAEELKVIGKHGIGVDNIPVEEATKRNIAVVNTPESNLEPVAEHAIVFMINCGKKILKADKALRQGHFEVREKYIGTHLADKTLGLIGIGKIGSLVSEKAINGFQMKVQAYDPYIKPQDSPEKVEVTDDLYKVLRSSKFVSIHCPLNESTRGLVGKKELEAMQDDAYLINTARGGVIKEENLITALEDGEIAGAALDTFSKEPPEPDNPLFEMDNVVVTPHMAALTEGAMIKMATHSAQGIIDVLNGVKPTWPVNEKVLKNVLNDKQ